MFKAAATVIQQQPNSSNNYNALPLFNGTNIFDFNNNNDGCRTSTTDINSTSTNSSDITEEEFKYFKQLNVIYDHNSKKNYRQMMKFPSSYLMITTRSSWDVFWLMLEWEDKKTGQVLL